jgi:predicted flap endonuclease-1-like 5' DNA nuclease
MANIREIEGIGDVYGEKLEGAGVKTVEGLLEKGGPKSGREELSEATGISEKMLLEWVNRADLMRVKGVGSEYSDLLEAAGVDSPLELARRNAENLAEKFQEVNAEKNLVRSVPSATVVQGWIDHAKTLEKAVTH